MKWISGKKSQSEEFERLLRPHVRHLYKVAYRLLGKAEDAEDLVQDVLTKLYPRTHEPASVEELRPWLTRVLHHQCIDTLRKRSRIPQNNPASPDAMEDIERLESPLSRPETRLEQGQAGERLQAALDRLDTEQRALIVLHLVEGYTLNELAEQLDTPLETLRTRLRRSRAQLRRLLAE